MLLLNEQIAILLKESNKPSHDFRQLLCIHNLLPSPPQKMSLYSKPIKLCAICRRGSALLSVSCLLGIPLSSSLLKCKHTPSASLREKITLTKKEERGCKVSYLPGYTLLLLLHPTTEDLQKDNTERVCVYPDISHKRPGM